VSSIGFADVSKGDADRFDPPATPATGNPHRRFALLAAIPCGGKQVHDANIVATMLVHGVPNLLTHNAADFKRFSHLIAVLPLVP